MIVKTNSAEIHVNAKAGTARLHSRKAPALPLPVVFKSLGKGAARELRKALYRAGKVALAATRCLVL